MFWPFACSLLHASYRPTVPYIPWNSLRFVPSMHKGAQDVLNDLVTTVPRSRTSWTLRISGLEHA